MQRLGAASVLLLPAPQLALFTIGVDSNVSGLVVQVGYCETTVLPVCCRQPLFHCAAVAKLGSRSLHVCIHSLALQVCRSFSPRGLHPPLESCPHPCPLTQALNLCQAWHAHTPQPPSLTLMQGKRLPAPCSQYSHAPLPRYFGALDYLLTLPPPRAHHATALLASCSQRATRHPCRY